MYESDEWYVQNDPTVRRKLGAKEGQYKSLADTEDHWDLDSSASDNESYELEVEQLENLEP